jgi:hypothetical protein
MAITTRLQVIRIAIPLKASKLAEGGLALKYMAIYHSRAVIKVTLPSADFLLGNH